VQILPPADDDDFNDEDDDEVGVQRDKALTRKTVRAIQQLFSEGRISLEQKRRLLNEIIQHANDDVPSMVEIAYELLLRNDDDGEYDNGRARPKVVSKEEDVLDEFADQCKIIADDMLPNL
jgi:hypothetical protein